MVQEARIDRRLKLVPFAGSQYCFVVVRVMKKCPACRKRKKKTSSTVKCVKRALLILVNQHNIGSDIIFFLKIALISNMYHLSISGQFSVSSSKYLQTKLIRPNCCVSQLRQHSSAFLNNSLYSLLTGYELLLCRCEWKSNVWRTSGKCLG